MAVKLIYKHQQKTYDLMNKSLEERGRAAYVYPTGCGKSFPALKYIEDNPDKKATIIVPSNFIKKQYEKNIIKYVENGEEKLKSGKINIVTYQDRHIKLKKEKEGIIRRFREIRKKGRIPLYNGKINNSSKNIALKIDKESDIVVFDEIHRMGANEWEKVVDKIIKENPKRKIIGMSATPERTDGRNMAYEKFGDDVVYEMSLTEALSGEKEGEVLLKSPNYIKVLSQLKSKLPMYKEEIDLIDDDKKREEYLSVYRKLDTIVSDSPDVQDIMLAGMKKTNGKYIVFCKDRNDLFDKIEHAKEIFGKVNSKINIDYVLTKKAGEYSDGKTKKENEKTLEDFETRENGDGLNLLFCVDMLNEGVHLNGIDGEVLFDLTTSPILYKQRIGRVLSADKEAGEVVIIDAANNWLNQIDTYKELEIAIQSGQKKNEKKDIDLNLLKLLPEEVELLDILREMGEIFKYNQGNYLRNAIEIQKWCEEKYGEKPIEERALPRISENVDEEERKLAVKLKRLKNRINKKYEGVPLEEIENEEHRKIIEIMRNLEKEYGLSNYLKNAIKIQKWCEKKYGEKPIEERFLPILGENVDLEERKLAEKFRNLRNVIAKKYKGKSLEEIEDKEHRKIVEIVRKLEEEYGLSDSLKDVIRIKKWCERNYGEKPIEERSLPTAGKNVDEEERKLAEKLAELRSRIVKRYERISVQEIKDEEHKKVVEMIRNLDEEYGLSDSLKNAIRIQKWCEKNYGEKPIEERSLPTVGKNADAEEKKLTEKYNNIRANIIRRYEGMSLEEIEDKNHRKIVEIIRNLDEEYGLSDSLKNAIKVQKWCEKNYGEKPIEERSLPTAGKNADAEEKRIAVKLEGLRIITRGYEGKSLEEIEDKEHRKIVEIIRNLDEEYEIPVNLKNTIKIQKWCEKNYGEKPIEERSLPSSGEDADLEEKNLAEKLFSIRKNIVKRYARIPIEEIEDKEHRKIVEIVRKLEEEYGLSGYLKNAIKIQKWCEKNYGEKPIEERSLPTVEKKVDTEEKALAKKLVDLRERIVKRYEGMSLEEIENKEHRKIVEIIRNLDEEYGLSANLRNAIEIQKWCEKKYGEKTIEERALPRRSENVDEEERKLALKLQKLKNRINKKYEGVPLEKIENKEHRKIVEIIRNLEENYMSKEQRRKKEAKINVRMKKAIGNQIQHNEETRKELEEKEKSVEKE